MAYLTLSSYISLYHKAYSHIWLPTSFLFLLSSHNTNESNFIFRVEDHGPISPWGSCRTFSLFPAAHHFTNSKDLRKGTKEKPNKKNRENPHEGCWVVTGRPLFYRVRWYSREKSGWLSVVGISWIGGGRGVQRWDPKECCTTEK